MILTIGSTKGGVGKSSWCLNVAVARALAGKDVWLVDGDRQRSAEKAVSIRSISGIKPFISCTHFNDGDILKEQVMLQSKKFDDVIIDVGGRDSTTLRAALLISDVLLVPFQPRNFDVWAFEELNGILKLAKDWRKDMGRKELITYAALNCADPANNANENEEAAEFVKEEMPGITYLPMSIGRRKAIAIAANSGMYVGEMPKKDKKSIAELEALINRIYEGV